MGRAEVQVRAQLDWGQIHRHILLLEQEGLVTRTFRRLDPEQQEVILNAILDETIEKGPTSLNIKQVAWRAGVSVGSLYNYFGSRDGLLAFAVELCARLASDTLDRFRPYLLALPLREALAMYLTGGVEWSRTQMGLIRFFARAAYQGDLELGDRVVRPIATTLLGLVRDMLAQAADRGEIRADVDLEAATRIVHVLMSVMGNSQLLPYLNDYYQVYGESISPERTEDALLELVLRGIGTET